MRSCENPFPKISPRRTQPQRLPFRSAQDSLYLKGKGFGTVQKGLNDDRVDP
jgi:hypothetical protein